LAWVLAALAVAPRQAQAQATPNPPGQISYQGFLTDANGIPLATNAPKNYVVTFTIYDALAGGNIKWAENQTVTVDRGYFSVMLGQGTAVSGSVPWTNNLTSIFTGATASSRYVGITVAGLPGQSTPAEIQPRLQLLASPYAFLAANANSISDNTGAQVLTTSGTSVGIDETPFSGDAMSVKGNVGIYENSVLDFGEGYGGQASDSGRIGYDYLSANALDIVGAGTATNNQHVKLWAGGGASTTGPLGVEIDTPAATLDVNGGAFFSAGAGLGSAGGRYGVSVFYDTSDNTGQIQSYQPGTAFENLTLNYGGGNVGIGTLSPQAKLEVNGVTYMDGGAAILNKNYLQFGLNVANRQVDAGKIGYQTFDNNLDIVGAGTGANRAITMFCEGGTTITGPLTTEGLVSAPTLAAGGGAVAAGDVFSLNGTGHLNNNRLYLRGGTDTNHYLVYDDSYGTDGPALVGNGGGVLGDSAGGYSWDLYWNSGGEVYVRNFVFVYGPVFGGAFQLVSDKSKKQNIEEVDAKTVLAKLEEMPVTKWNYTNTPSVAHIGPMAQDFAASFGYGVVTNDDQHISLGDEVGVSLAAIKGLNQTVKEQNAELQALKKEVADLKALVESLAPAKNARP
jgi:hypothetical protein